MNEYTLAFLGNCLATYLISLRWYLTYKTNKNCPEFIADGVKLSALIQEIRLIIEYFRSYKQATKGLDGKVRIVPPADTG